jgi:hypothetical protein
LSLAAPGNPRPALGVNDDLKIKIKEKSYKAREMRKVKRKQILAKRSRKTEA